MEDPGGEVTLELEVGQDDLFAVGAPTPADVREAPHRAPGPVTPRDEPRSCLLQAVVRAQGRPRVPVRPR